LAGWQEHTNSFRDRHGRFAYADSLQRRFAIVDRPVVDAYRLMLADTLRSYGIPVGQRTWAGKEWAVCPTHDVDYLRKWRPGIVYRELVEYGVLNRRRVPLRERAQRVKASVQSWLGPRDPYTMSLRRMIEAEHRRGITATYFVKTGAHRPYDPAYALHHGEGRQRIWDLQAKGFEIGLHPTYFAASHAGYMGAEARMLKDVTERSARSVRQHYLCFDPDVTPRLHEQTGFSFDSTLGFADQEGFRHGTCHPFRLYDIRENRPYGLVEFPLIIMEATLFNRRHLDTGEALTVTRNLMDTCRRFRGVCTILWHEIIYDPIDCPGWADHFEGTLDLALEEDAYIASIHDIWDSQGMAGV
ncbi:MAG: polysaccharide deacetylase family protein, partial [Bacteroidota bacterium]